MTDCRNRRPSDHNRQVRTHTRVISQRIREAAKAALAGASVTFFVDPYCDQSKLVWRTKSALGVKTHVIANGSKRQMEALLVEAQRVFGVWLMNGCKDEE